MRITKISVKGLFGYLDHEIPLNQESRITIIHGPNGVGKTVLMRMVHGLFHFDYEFIGQTPFERLSVFFNNGSIIHVKGLCEDSLAVKYERTTHRTSKRLLIEFVDKNGVFSSTPFVPFCSGIRHRIFEAMRESNVKQFRHIPFASDESQWLNIETNQVWATGNILNAYTKVRKKVFGNVPGWFARVRKRATSKLIQTQRVQLLQSDPNEPSLTDLGISDLDSEEAQDYSSDPAYVLRLRPTISGEDQGVFFFDDEFETEEVTLFEEIINERMLFKKTSYGENYGLHLVSPTGSIIQPENLSSGEQHLLVLYYQLLFNIEPNTLVMIDEPELSMNVVWQRNFLKDLQRIIELREFDVLIATHSPQIIHDKWDWMVPLGENIESEEVDD